MCTKLLGSRVLNRMTCFWAHAAPVTPSTCRRLNPLLFQCCTLCCLSLCATRPRGGNGSQGVTGAGLGAPHHSVFFPYSGEHPGGIWRQTGGGGQRTDPAGLLRGVQRWDAKHWRGKTAEVKRSSLALLLECCAFLSVALLKVGSGLQTTLRVSSRTCSQGTDCDAEVTQ